MEAFKSAKQTEAELKEQCNGYKKALERIVKTYDNVEDLAGQIAREALDKFK